MGYYTERDGTTSFRPDDDENTMYIASDYGSISMDEILAKIKEKWGDIGMDNIKIRSEYIHTSCIGYDQYDGGDYTNYIVIER